MKHGAFTSREDQILSECHRDRTAAELAGALGRSLSSTQSRLRHLGLRKRPSERPTTTRVTILFDDDLMPRIRGGAEAANLSMSAYVQELVRAGLPQKRKRKVA